MTGKSGQLAIRTALCAFLLVLAPHTLAAGEESSQVRYLQALIPLVDQLLSTQITDPDDPDFGALVSPSNNPQANPRHSRAAEAVYPIAVSYKHTKDAKYRDAAISLGNWLVGLQQDDGSWGEDWPGHDGWNGTTADQLISLAGALELLRPELEAAELEAWEEAITMAADFSTGRFPGTSNINYTPTAAVGLVLAYRAVQAPKAGWLDKAASLIAHVSAQINTDKFIVGEGKGVDLGYNIAQSIGFIAWYGILQDDPAAVDLAASVLKTHLYFMYPNGAIDNSWGTRSFKWTLESGSKTAPGVHFSFGLLADRDPAIARGAVLALDWLQHHALDAENRVVYGPHAYLHENSNPPSNYQTFARAQSIATAVEFGPEPMPAGPIPAEEFNWVQLFSTIETAVLRTKRVMATLSSYANNERYPLETAVRGGSATVVWFEGYGPDGFLQVSSQTEYRRIESRHMPKGIDPLPLTPRIETIGDPFQTNLFDPGAVLAVTDSNEAIEVVSSGALRDKDGAAGPSFQWTHSFHKGSYSKTVEIASANGIRIVEPFVDNPGNSYALEGDDTFVITTEDGGQWQLKIESSNVPYSLSHGEQRDRYYHPFPGFNAYPLIISLGSSGPAALQYTVSNRHKPIPAELKAIEQGRHGEIRTTVDVNWNSYPKIQLERATVAFRKNWVRDQESRNQVTIRDSDLERIKTDMADLLDEVLTREMTKECAYTMTNESGPGVMRFTPRIVDLNIHAPDRVRNYIGYSLTDSQGSMTLELGIQDSASGALLATTRHHQVDPYKGYMEWTNSGTNRRSARLMLQRWASGLCERLIEARSASN